MKKTSNKNRVEQKIESTPGSTYLSNSIECCKIKMTSQGFIHNQVQFVLLFYAIERNLSST